MLNQDILAFRKFGRKKGYWNSGRGPIFYFKHELFPNIDFNNKTVLDIGSGKGVFCGIASLMGAKKVVGLEPEHHGSTSGVLSSFEEMKEELNMENIFCFPYTFQEYYDCYFPGIFQCENSKYLSGIPILTSGGLLNVKSPNSF